MVLNILPPFALEVVVSTVKHSWTNSGSGAESMGSPGVPSEEKRKQQTLSNCVLT